MTAESHPVISCCPSTEQQSLDLCLLCVESSRDELIYHGGLDDWNSVPTDLHSLSCDRLYESVCLSLCGSHVCDDAESEKAPWQ
jgi:hypothetical protein